jgi:hypothetical protein
MAKENEKGFAESRQRFDEGMAEMRREIAARDVVMDKRIGDLVLAIGKLIARMDVRNSGGGGQQPEGDSRG